MTLFASASRSTRLLVNSFNFSKFKVATPGCTGLLGRVRIRTIVTRCEPMESSLLPSKVNISQYIKRQIDDVIASPEDKRQYRGLELTNGLKILLVSDPTTDKSAASMDVMVGHLHDPDELPGLAHFCEHMLFLGTGKYPEENEYQKYLSAHGGGSNAYTASDHTNYHFDVAAEYLSGAIDRFSQFFLRPLFTASGTKREVMAVDSEHQNNVQNDAWRLCQLERSLSDAAHPYAKFGTGNKKTLLDDARTKNLDPRNELLKFHEKFYSSNVMGLAVLGKESLDELCEIVVPAFAQIPNHDLPMPEWKQHPYGQQQLGYRVNVVPVKDLRSMHLFFPIPDLLPHYKSNPGHYVSHLLGHEGAGSLLSELKKLGLVNSLSAGPQATARGFGFFQVDFELTEEGLEHVDDILALTFQYLKMMTTEGPKEWIHREVESLGNIQFRFQDKAKPQSYVTNLSNSLHYYPINEVLYAAYMMPDYKPDLINTLLDMLHVNNAGYTVVSQKFKGQTDKCEKWYGTEYSMQRVSLADQCRQPMSPSGDSSAHCPRFRLPEPNEFIPDDFRLFVDRAADDPDLKEPTLLHNDPRSRLWFKQDQEFLLPKCCVFVHIRSPVVYQDPLNHALCALFVDLLRDSLTEYSYNAELAGLRYGLSNGRYGVSLNVSGYNQKQKVLLVKLVDKMVRFVPDADRFRLLKERYVRALKNFAMEQPYQHAVYYANTLLTDKVWTKEEILKEAEGLTIDQLSAFKSKFFEALHIEAYVHGNADENQAEDLLNSVRESLDKSIHFKPLYASQVTRDRSVCLEEGRSYFYEATNKTHSNSAMEIVLQTGVEEPRLNMLNELLGQILQEPCFNQLRTQEQLGYIVFSGLRRSNGAQGLRFIVQGEKSADFMDGRLEAFLEQMETNIDAMSDQEFEQHKTALANVRLERPKKLSSMAAKYWSEISAEQYHFKRDKDDVEVLKTITKSDLMTFYKEIVSKNAPKRKKLSIYVCSSNENNSAKTLNPPIKSDKVVDIVTFKSRLPLYPLAKPYRDDVPPIGLEIEPNF